MSNMPVNENEQLVATQLAYVHFDEAVREIIMNRSEQERNNPVTVDEAIQYALKNDIQLFNSPERFFSLGENGEVKYVEGYEQIADWKIISPVDDKDNTGFAACIFDTGDARILACRGSESMGDLINLKEDWVEADLMLLNSEMTKQEEALANYLRENADYLSEKPWVSTGHSLGGALADYAAIMSVELTDDNGNKIGIDNYSGTINFDGPNHSFEFQKKYKDAIAEVSPQMEHRIASIVGELLPKMPGVKVDYIETMDGIDIFNKHDTVNWLKLSGGTQSSEGYIAEKLTTGADRLPSFIGNIVPILALTIVNGVTWIKDFSDKHPELAATFAVSAVLFLIANPSVAMIAIEVVAAIIVTIAAIVIISFVGELIYEALTALAQMIVEKVCEVVNWIKDEATELFEAVSNLIKNVKEWFHNKFDKGAKYAKEHPYFKADTDRLYSYATRLQNVNRRLSNLDNGIRSLYWQVGFSDLWDILCADLITCESYSLNKAKSYLTETAERLITADRNVKIYLEG